MNGNKALLIGGSVLVTLGFVSAVSHNKPKTPVFAGAIGVLLLASLVATFGEAFARAAAGIVILAATTAVFVEGPELVTALTTAQKHGQAAPLPPGSGTPPKGK